MLDFSMKIKAADESTSNRTQHMHAAAAAATSRPPRRRGRPLVDPRAEHTREFRRRKYIIPNSRRRCGDKKARRRGDSSQISRGRRESRQTSSLSLSPKHRSSPKTKKKGYDDADVACFPEKSRKKEPRKPRRRMKRKIGGLPSAISEHNTQRQALMH